MVRQVIAIATILAAVLGIAWLAYTFLTSLSASDATVQSAIIAGLFALVLLVFTYWTEQSKSRREAHRDKKIEAYSVFFDIIFQLIDAERPDGSKKINMESDEFRKEMIRLKRNIMFYGSPGVLNAFTDWLKSSSASHESTPEKIFRRIGRILLAMRRDIGLSNFGLNELTIHQIYLTDDISKIGSTE
ncbi:MAG: hypothetical protein P0Y66_02225 [Candidatus Kaistia colombiensis]|nr:MAG: hypothetical protein P0Y66_02225 [Kaistia sp.]